MRSSVSKVVLAALISSAPFTTSCDSPGAVDGGTDARVRTDSGRADTGVTLPADGGRDAGSLPRCDGPPGLFQDEYCQVLATGVRPFVPLHVLWTDGAAKERSIFLPPGATIDTSDPDRWVFPVDTRIYKTFLLDGVRLETRVFRKTTAGAGFVNWEVTAYAWNSTQTAVMDVTEDGAQNVLGTQHDIPNRAMCQQCHQAAGDIANGFSALQLNHAGAGLSLSMLADEGRLSNPISLADAVFPSTGAAGNESAALGALHANCGHCHRTAGVAAGTGLLMWVNVAATTPADTDTYLTAVNRHSNITFPLVGGETADCRLAGGHPERSVMLIRMQMQQMPPIGTEVRNTAAEDALTAWIGTLPDTGLTSCPP